MSDYKLLLTFEEGSVRQVDLATHLDEPVFEPLKEMSYFKTVYLNSDLDTIVWNNGAGVPTSGEPKEKGVDALLVADLIYHAAQKNMDYAQLVAIDLDFVFAIRRVEDFGCRSAVLAFGQEAPEGLRKSSYDYRFIGKDELVRYKSIVKGRTN